MPSEEYVKRIADVLDYLVNDSDQEEILENDAVKRFKEIQHLYSKEKDIR